jgi:hypothetical protein
MLPVPMKKGPKSNPLLVKMNLGLDLKSVKAGEDKDPKRNEKELPDEKGKMVYDPVSK